MVDGWETRDPETAADPTLAASEAPDFARVLATHGLPPLARGAVQTLQVNVGKLCNQACHHARRRRTKRTEIMQPATIAQVLALLARARPWSASISPAARPS
jgi:hypothetical protein